MNVDLAIYDHLMEILVVVLALLVVTGAWLFLMATRSKARRLRLAAFGVTVDMEFERRASVRKEGDDG